MTRALPRTEAGEAAALQLGPMATVRPASLWLGKAKPLMVMEIPATLEARGAAISAPLTPREVEVLQAISTGLNNTDIAAALNRSLDTVKSHLKAILQKLQARNRTHAVVCALIAGIVLLPAAAPNDTKSRTTKSPISQQAPASKMRAEL